MKKNKRSKFYAVAGCNAYGVYDDYDRILESRPYIASYKCKSFNNYEDAKYAAEEMFFDLQKDVFAEYEIPEIKKINWCYYKKKSK